MRTESPSTRASAVGLLEDADTGIGCLVGSGRCTLFSRGAIDSRYVRARLGEATTRTLAGAQSGKSRETLTMSSSTGAGRATRVAGAAGVCFTVGRVLYGAEDDATRLLALL